MSNRTNPSKKPVKTKRQPKGEWLKRINANVKRLRQKK